MNQILFIALTIVILSTNGLAFSARAEAADSTSSSVDHSLMLLSVGGEAETELNRDAVGGTQSAVTSGLKSGRYQSVQTRPQPSSAEPVKSKSPQTRDTRKPSSVDSGLESQKTSQEKSAQQTTEVNQPKNTPSEISPQQDSELNLRRLGVFRSALDLQLGQMHESTRSEMSLRDYALTAPAYALQLRIWHPKALGFGLRYGSTLGGAIDKRQAGTIASRVETGYQVLYRAWSDQVSEATFGIELFESRLTLDSAYQQLLSTQSTGGAFLAELKLRQFFGPVHQGHWHLGFRIAPWINHSELSGATTVRSGRSPESTVVGLEVRRQWMIQSRRSLSLGFVSQFERNVFSGQSAGVDPQTLLPVNGVIATRNSTVIQFGYHWGAD